MILLFMKLYHYQRSNLNHPDLAFLYQGRDVTVFRLTEEYLAMMTLPLGPQQQQRMEDWKQKYWADFNSTELPYDMLWTLGSHNLKDMIIE